MTPLLLSIIVFAAIMAEWWSRSDFKKIIGRILTGDFRDLNHSELLGWRIWWLVFGMGGAAGWIAWTGASMWLLVPGATVAWSVFGIVHVFRLNALRGLSIWYMSPSNKWDTFWIRTVMVNDEAVGSDDTHKAGKRAFYFRLLVLSLSVVCWIVVNR